MRIFDVVSRAHRCRHVETMRKEREDANTCNEPVRQCCQKVNNVFARALPTSKPELRINISQAAEAGLAKAVAENAQSFGFRRIREAPNAAYVEKAWVAIGKNTGCSNSVMQKPAVPSPRQH